MATPATEYWDELAADRSVTEDTHENKRQNGRDAAEQKGVSIWAGWAARDIPSQNTVLDRVQNNRVDYLIQAAEKATRQTTAAEQQPITHSLDPVRLFHKK